MFVTVNVNRVTYHELVNVVTHIVDFAILAGGKSSRLGRDKGLLDICGKPMFLWVLEACRPYANKILIVTSDIKQKKAYEERLNHFNVENVKVVVDEESGVRCPLIGAKTAFRNAEAEYTFLLSCDVPLVDSNVLQLLISISKGYDAVVPRWPNGYIEPLHSIYKTDKAFNAAKSSLAAHRFDMRAVLERLNKILYVSTLIIKKVDHNLFTFFNVNSPMDLKKLKKIMKNQ